MPPGRGGVGPALDRSDARQQFLGGGADLHACQLGTEAEVGTEPKGEMWVSRAADVESERLVKHREEESAPRSDMETRSPISNCRPRDR